MSYEEQLLEVFGPSWTDENSPVEIESKSTAKLQGQGNQGEVKLKKQEQKNSSSDDFLMQWNMKYQVDPKSDVQKHVSPKVSEINIDSNAVELVKNEEMQSGKSSHTSQFDSKASDYFLLLNKKNEAIVKGRKQVKMSYSKAVLEYEQIFADREKKKIEKEYELMQKIQEDSLNQQTILIKTMQKEREPEKEVLAMQEELKRGQMQYENDKIIMESMKQQLEEQIKTIESTNLERKKLDEEKTNFKNYKLQQQELLKKEKEKLVEIQRKLKLKSIKQDQEKEKLVNEAKELSQKIEELLQIQNKEKEMIKIQSKKDQQQTLENNKEKNEVDQKQPDEKKDEKKEWKPDPLNKQKNLAVQFLEFTLKGREFLNLDLRELQNPVQIGEGAAAIVYKAQYKYTDVAVKKLKAQNLIVDGVLSIEFQREVEALTQISHPNLVLFMGATADQGHPVIVTEFCHGGTLFEVLHEKKKSIQNISFKQRWKMAVDIAKGMHFMHSLNPPLMHRDLKSLNLLLAEKITGPNDYVNVKVTDFGLTRTMNDDSGMMTGQAGTFHWMAPEVLENQPYTIKADVYSYGIVLWEILSREPPFANHTPHQIIYGVINHKERPLLDKISPDCPKELIVIMRACWEQNPLSRPSFGDVIQGLNMLNITN